MAVSTYSDPQFLPAFLSVGVDRATFSGHRDGRHSQPEGRVADGIMQDKLGVMGQREFLLSMTDTESSTGRVVSMATRQIRLEEWRINWKGSFSR